MEQLELPLTLPTRFPGSTEIETPDTSETYPGGEPADEDWTPEVEAMLEEEGFDVAALKRAWGSGEKIQ